MRTHTTVQPLWTGEPCFIIACGPSLRHMRVEHLTSYGRVIVINDSYQLVPDADLLYFCDQRWWNSRGDDVRERYRGRYIATLENEIHGVWHLRNTGLDGLEESPDGLRMGSNSGYQAINLAYHLGCPEVYLLGYDMHVDGDHMHWNARPERQTPNVFDRTLHTVMLPHFKSLAQALEGKMRVVNCTPHSHLRDFPYEALDDVTRRLKESAASA